jgi:HEAT repeat protein
MLAPKTDQVVPNLIAMLADKSLTADMARHTAIQALGKIGTPAVPLLLQALRNPEPLVRDGAANALYAMGAQASAATPALVAALDDSESFVRGMAAAALGAIGVGAQQAVPALLRLLNDSTDISLLSTGAVALGQIVQAVHSAHLTTPHARRPDSTQEIGTSLPNGASG